MKKQLKIDSRDLASLKKMVARLAKVNEKKLDDAICDIIDAGGYSLAVLLDNLEKLPAEVQMRASRRIEDFLYFHPEAGAKLLNRLKKAVDNADTMCKSYLFSALVDVVENLEENNLEASRLGDAAMEVIKSDTDFSRKSKAIDALAKTSNVKAIPIIIKLMMLSVSGVENFQNYQFVESCLLALKRMGGEELIKLLINPSSDAAIRQLRLEWRDKSPSLLKEVVAVLQELDSDFAQMMLKVVDLSDFNLPFIAMIKEALSHGDKWVRQAAVASMEKAASALDPESLSRMLNDSAGEVRLMAASSLGGFPVEHTGHILEELALRNGESLELRLNALYALYAQKNSGALKKLSEQDGNLKLALNAQGLRAMLLPREEGQRMMMKAFLIVGPDLTQEAAHYMMELLDVDDIQMLINAHASADSETKKERLIALIRGFIDKNAGPRLDSVIAKLPDAEQKALKLFRSGPSDEVPQEA